MSDLISKLKTMEPGPDIIKVEGWVRTKRDSKTVTLHPRLVVCCVVLQSS